VSGADVQRGKPAPDIFLKAAAALGVPPERCLVFEDAPAGVAAAHAAGMRAWALLTSHARAELAAADVVVPDFLALSPAAVQATWTPRPA
jgi:sugar-phosphatase